MPKNKKTAVYLTLPLSTMSLCRSLDDRTSSLIACISSVQEAKILQGATEQRTQTLTCCNISADTEVYVWQEVIHSGGCSVLCLQIGSTTCTRPVCSSDEVFSQNDQQAGNSAVSLWQMQFTKSQIQYKMVTLQSSYCMADTLLTSELLLQSFLSQQKLCNYWENNFIHQ